MTIAPPNTAPYPVASFLKLDAKSASKRLLSSCKDGSETKCEINARIGIFFDGTNNNLERDREGVRIMLPEQHGSSPAKMGRPLLPSEYSHSNVARLFRAYQETDRPRGRFSYYIPGVGTPFDEIGEPTETSDGKVAAAATATPRRSGASAARNSAAAATTSCCSTTLTTRPHPAQEQLCDTDTLSWCSRFMREGETCNQVDVAREFLNYEKELMKTKNEDLQNTV